MKGWIILTVSPPEPRFLCESCGSELRINRILPQPLDVVAGIAKVFDQHHRRTCGDPGPARRALLAVLRAHIQLTEAP